MAGRPWRNSTRFRQRLSSLYASDTVRGSRLFQASSAMRTFCTAVSAVKGGKGGRDIRSPPDLLHATPCTRPWASPGHHGRHPLPRNHCCLSDASATPVLSRWAPHRPGRLVARRHGRLGCVGTVSFEALTFLFTDIEGSTRLWQEYPTTMPDALARHDAIARTAIADGGGRLFKHTGDGVCAAFADARAAVATAVALQRAVAAATWGDGPRPSVRVAIDSGPAYQRDGDYFGATLNRTARVLGVGSGGQILTTAACVGLTPEADTIDL